MITIDGLTSKWRFYRNTLVACFFINVLVVITGMCLAVDHWHTALKGSGSQEQLFSRLESADKLEVAVQNLKSPSKKDATSEFLNWSEIKIQLMEIGAPALPLEVMNSSEARAAYLAGLETDIRSKKMTWMKEWRQTQSRDAHVVRLIIIISALSLIFGLLLPLYCFHRISRILVRTKDDLQKAAQNIVAEWLKAAHRFGEDPFRNIEFWLHIVLIAAAYIGESSRHPAAQVAAELAHLVRRELKKNGIAFEGDIRPRA